MSIKNSVAVPVLISAIATALVGSSVDAAPAAQAGAAADGGNASIVCTRVFDGIKVIPQANVTIANGRIAAIAAGCAAMHEGDIDGRGKTLLPGLIDAHVHAWGNARRDALRFGVTTELDQFSDWHALADARKQRVSLAKTDQADLWSAGTLATAPGGHGTEYGMAIPTITKPDQAQAFVDARIKKNSDWIKIVRDDGTSYSPTFHLPTLSSETVKALIVAAHARHMIAVIHIIKREDARQAIADGVDGLAHIFADEPADATIVQLAVRNKTFVIPTLAVTSTIAGDPHGQRLIADPNIGPMLTSEQKQTLVGSFPDTNVRFLPNAVTSVRMLHAAGVPILAGTDAGNPGTAHGASLHEELALLVKAGLTPTQALNAATALPAKIFGLNDRSRIAKGLRADMVLVDGDPTRDILVTRKIVGIWKNGYAVDRTLPAEPAKAAALTPPSDPLISDFEGAKIDSRYGFGWMTSTDAMAGGASIATIALAKGGANGSHGALAINGEIKPGFAYPWSGAIFFPSAQPMQGEFDYSKRKQLVFRVKGDGRRYEAMLFTAANPRMPSMQTFVAGKDWSEVALDLSGFQGADLSHVTALAFTAGTPNGTFAFQIDDVRLR
ncbi:MAG: CIA30 family protein [Lysobacteraceae bacterium]